MKLRTPSGDDFRYVVAETMLKHVKNQIDEAEIERFESQMKSILALHPNMKIQLNILVPITLLQILSVVFAET